MSNIDILKKLEKIIESDAKNYFESSERVSLMNLLNKLKIDNYKLSNNELHSLNNFIKKYAKLGSTN